MSSSLAAYARQTGQRLFDGGLGGLLCGLVVGGIGGRLAMLMLRLTSGPEVVGVTSDDGFTIGFFTGSTILLLGLTSMVGAVLGVVYLAVRNYLPDRLRAPLTGALLAVVGGAAIVEPGGVDFTLLEPRWLALASFVLLPGLFGVALSKVVDRLLQHRIRHAPWVALGAGAVVLVLIATEGGSSIAVVVAVLALFFLGWIATTKAPALKRIPAMPPVVWVARAAMLAGGLFAAADLARDVAEIL